METYLAAIVSFYLKPRKRLWQADGIQSLVEITAPKVIEVHRSKDLSQMEAQQRLSYLADIVDTQGWAVRGVGTPAVDTPMQNDAYFEAQQAEDILDTTGGVSRSFDSMINQSDAKRHQEMMARMQQAPTVQASIPQVADPYATMTSTAAPAGNAPDPSVIFNPYPNSMHQTVISPLGSRPLVQPAPSPLAPAVAAPQLTPVAPNPPTATSEKVVSPDIINLANNSDLSIETIAHEANRIHEREKLPDDEVIISLR